MPCRRSTSLFCRNDLRSKPNAWIGFNKGRILCPVLLVLGPLFYLFSFQWFDICASCLNSRSNCNVGLYSPYGVEIIAEVCPPHTKCVYPQLILPPLHQNLPHHPGNHQTYRPDQHPPTYLSKYQDSHNKRGQAHHSKKMTCQAYIVYPE